MESAWRNGVTGVNVLPSEDTDFVMRTTQRESCKQNLCFFVMKLVVLRRFGGTSE